MAESSDVRESIDISVDPEEVWDLVMDPNRLGDWVGAHRGVSDVPERRLEAGDAFEQKMSLAGRSFKVSWKLVESERPSLAVWEADGPAGTGADVRYELSARNGGTHFDYVNEFSLPGGPLAFVGKSIAGAPARMQAKASLRKLKEILERG